MIQVIENILPITLQQQIEDVLLSRNFPWYYNKSTIEGYLPDDTPQFTHTACINGSITSHITWDLISPLFQKIQECCNFKMDEVERSKFNLLLKRSENIHIHPPHCDAHVEGYKSLVYYVHDTDGDTFIYNKKFKNKPEILKWNELDLIKRLTPKRGTLLMFDSNLYHSSSLPMANERRIILNSVVKI